jgi:hypothetical protein
MGMVVPTSSRRSPKSSRLDELDMAPPLAPAVSSILSPVGQAQRTTEASCWALPMGSRRTSSASSTAIQASSSRTSYSSRREGCVVGVPVPKASQGSRCNQNGNPGGAYYNQWQLSCQLGVKTQGGVCTTSCMQSMAVSCRLGSKKLMARRESRS